MTQRFFAFLIMTLFLGLSIPAPAMWNEDDEDDVDLLKAWSDNDSPEDATLTSLQLKKDIPTAELASVSVKNQVMDSLMQTMSIYASPDRKAGQSVYMSLAGDAQALDVIVLNQDAFRKKYPEVASTIEQDGRIINTPDNLASQKLNRRGLTGLEMFLKSKKAEGVPLEKRQNFVRKLVASLCLEILSTAGDRKMTLDLLSIFWGTIFKPDGTLRENSEDLWRRTDHVMYKRKIPGTYESESIGSLAQIFNVLLSLLRYRGPELFLQLTPLNTTNKQISFAAELPVSDAIIKIMAQDNKHREWWLLFNRKMHKKGHGSSSKMSPEELLGLPAYMKSRSADWPDLTRALQTYIENVYEGSGVVLDFHLMAAALEHALIRQRPFVYKLTRPFFPGVRPESFKEADTYYEKLLEVHDTESVTNDLDLMVVKIFNELNALAQSGSETEAAEALMMLLEAPMALYMVDTTLNELKRLRRPAAGIFEWLAHASHSITDGLYFDYLTSQWPIAHTMLTRQQVAHSMALPSATRPSRIQLSKDMTKMALSTVQAVDKIFDVSEASRKLQLLMADIEPICLTACGYSSHSLTPSRAAPVQTLLFEDADLMKLTTHMVPTLVPSMYRRK
ncbi:hypothetical protein [Parendozoicomonas haliclonae]|uniref:Uncharacterized protein n=1 Tax=Parendozoicomonas haliclonae TaxID=1960125 RepID=A0A1X7AJ22_9GAMM|nr:hypothetical protein [Parendozoicomonas haliclonae]SMA45892.1 hypothetical protein EHSB41UT_02023 [Parendozoicomonas haliclonae]